MSVWLWTGAVPEPQRSGGGGAPIGVKIGNPGSDFGVPDPTPKETFMAGNVLTLTPMRDIPTYSVPFGLNG